MRHRKRAWRVRSCSVLRKWSICDVRLSHGVVLERRLNAAFFIGLCSRMRPRFFTTIKSCTLKEKYDTKYKTYTAFFLHSLKWRKHQTHILNVGFLFQTHKVRLLHTPMYHDDSSNSAFKSACLVVKIMVYGFFFNCTTLGQASDSMTSPT